MRKHWRSRSSPCSNDMLLMHPIASGVSKWVTRSGRSRVMVHVSRMKKAWWISRAIRGGGCLPTDARQQRNRTLTLGAPGLFIRVVASSLLLNAVFPTDVLAQTRPAAVTQQAPAQPFNTEQLDA